MSKMNMLKTRTSCYNAAGDVALARVSRVSFLLCLFVYLLVTCKANTEQTKINSRWLESCTAVSTSNVILATTCEIRTAYASAGLLTSEFFSFV